VKSRKCGLHTRLRVAMLCGRSLKVEADSLTCMNGLGVLGQRFIKSRLNFKKARTTARSTTCGEKTEHIAVAGNCSYAG